MTVVESDHMWSTNFATHLEHQMMQQISEILIQEHGNARALPKHVSRKTNIPPDTIKKWKNGLNPPRLGYFLLLLKHYPEVLKFMLQLVGFHPAPQGIPVAPANADTRNSISGPAAYSAKYCTINLSLPLRIASELNQRQLWFLGLLQRGERRKADHIAATWQVSHRMAMYDVEALVKQGLIRFKGAKKNGWYEPT